MVERIYLSKIDMVTAALRELIQNGELRAGDGLRQRDLAARFGVSTTPVREALRRLESEGLVRHSTHSGATVVEVDYGATVENYRIRAALESLAVRMAAEVATDADIRAVEKLNQRLARSTDPQRVNELNRRLHFRIYEIADSPLLLALLRRLWNAFPMGPQASRPVAESVEQHARIIEALRAHDPAAAAEATEYHILEAASHTVAAGRDGNGASSDGEVGAQPRVGLQVVRSFTEPGAG
jgi:DNA-binding GntR family transcriptional regulator